MYKTNKLDRFKDVEIPVDVQKQYIPFFFSESFMWPVGKNYLFSKQLDLGYAYMLTEIRTKWPFNQGVTLYPDINVEFTKISHSRELQDEPISLRLLSSPCNVGIVSIAGKMKSSIVPPHAKLNEFYCYRDTIQINFRPVTPVINSFPFEFVIVGYYVPEPTYINLFGGN